MISSNNNKCILISKINWFNNKYNNKFNNFNNNNFKGTTLYLIATIKFQ